MLKAYYEFRNLHKDFDYTLGLKHLTAWKITREPMDFNFDYDTLLNKANRELNEEALSRNRGSANYLFINRKEADK